MTPTTDLQKLADLATLDVERLEKELDITNADHIALWLASAGQMSISYLAVQIANAYDRANAARVVELEAENARLRGGLMNIDALAPLRELMNMMHPNALTGLVLRMGEIARTALKGGEI
jgi:hypothetical protein